MSSKFCRPHPWDELALGVAGPASPTLAKALSHPIAARSSRASTQLGVWGPAWVQLAHSLLRPRFSHLGNGEKSSLLPLPAQKALLR